MIFFMLIDEEVPEYDRKSLAELEKSEAYKSTAYFFCDQRIINISKTDGLKEEYLVVDTIEMFFNVSHIVRADRFVSTKRYGYNNFPNSIGVLN